MENKTEEAEVITQSPLPTTKQATAENKPVNYTPITMSFPKALQQVIDGKRITRVEWENSDDYGVLKDGWLMIHTKDHDYQWLVSDGDLLSEDWIVLPDVN